MTDIVGRLRAAADGLWSTNLAHIPEAMSDAADEIERLRNALITIRGLIEGDWGIEQIREVVDAVLPDLQTTPSGGSK